jgi:hypothetical protein
MDQTEFFPVPQLRNNVDYVDISTLEDFQSSSGGAKEWSFFDIPKGKYICFKTGYTNKYFPERGPIFPGLQNKQTGKWLTPTVFEDDISYPNFGITVDGKTRKILMHKLVGQCFLINDQPELKRTVDHTSRNKKDWSLDNLVWKSQKGNAQNKGK